VPYPIRILLFFLTMPFHAFIGTMLMGSRSLVAEDWYLAFNRTWGPSPMQDQYWAGAILWATGDLTMLGVMSALFLGWYRESVREAKRVDRQLDREDAARDRAAAVIADGTMQPLSADHEDLSR
jgi:putative copper resistance protein D